MNETILKTAVSVLHDGIGRGYTVICNVILAKNNNNNTNYLNEHVYFILVHCPWQPRLTKHCECVSCSVSCCCRLKVEKDVP